VRLHDLRHTCASLAISSGANVKVVQRLLGHKSAVLTLDRYGHWFPTTWTRWPTPSMRRPELLRTDCVLAEGWNPL
jgi:integrase